MKKYALPVAAAVIIFAVIVWIAVNSLMVAIDESMCVRHAADIQSIAYAIESYKIDNGRYPVALTVEELRNALEPTYAYSVPSYGLRYFSDGDNHTIISGPFVDGPYPRTNCPGFEYRNGVFVSWPDFVWQSDAPEHPN